MKSKNEMTLQKVTCANICQHAINLRRVHSQSGVYDTPTFNKISSKAKVQACTHHPYARAVRTARVRDARLCRP